MKLKSEFKEEYEVNENISIWNLVRIMCEYDLKTADIFVIRNYSR